MSLPRKHVENFCRNVRSLTRDYGAVTRLAEAVEFGRDHVSSIIHGRTKPTLEFAVAVARALDYSLCDLLLPPKEFSKIRR